MMIVLVALSACAAAASGAGLPDTKTSADCGAAGTLATDSGAAESGDLDDSSCLLQASLRPARASGRSGLSAAARAAQAAGLVPAHLVFPREDRPGRLPHEHTTVTLGGFMKNDFINARYTERYGTNYTVNDRPTFWSNDLRFFIYYCKWHDAWGLFSASKLEAMRDERECWYTAKGLVGQELVDISLPKGWSEWDQAAGQLVVTPKAGLNLLSAQEWLDGEGGGYDSLDIFPQCKRPPYKPIDYEAVYTGQLSERDSRTSYRQVNQGTCDNCWAVATAALIERLICIHGENRWIGPRALLSPAYLTSCSADAFVAEDGCGGGYPLRALRWAGEHGVPTGGSRNSLQTCVPNFPSNMSGATVAPPCPTSCSNTYYPRSLQEDLFRPEGLQDSWQTTALESAKLAMRYGPILIIIPLYENFYDYKGGLYNETSGKYIMDHIMVAHGYTKERIAGFNSWGDDWGYEGSFWIAPSLIKFYIIPGEIVGEGPGYPYPLPPAVFQVRLDGFSDPALNGKYELFMHSWGDINGHNSFWKGDNIVLYWCSDEKRWAVAKLGHVSLKDARSYLRDHEVWRAHSPVLSHYTSMKQLEDLTGWTEKEDDSGSSSAKGVVQVWWDNR